MRHVLPTLNFSGLSGDLLPVLGRGRNSCPACLLRSFVQNVVKDSRRYDAVRPKQLREQRHERFALVHCQTYHVPDKREQVLLDAHADAPA